MVDTAFGLVFLVLGSVLLLRILSNVAQVALFQVRLMLWDKGVHLLYDLAVEATAHIHVEMQRSRFVCFDRQPSPLVSRHEVSEM